MSATRIEDLSRDGDYATRTAGIYTVVVTLRDVAGHRWYRIALEDGLKREVQGWDETSTTPGCRPWVAEYDTHDVARVAAEANRVVCVFRSGRTVEDVAEEYAWAQDVANQAGYSYRNVSARDITVARGTVDLLAPLSVAQRVYDLTHRPLAVA